jgi:polysaccharide biosynthesis transport protein
MSASEGSRSPGRSAAAGAQADTTVDLPGLAATLLRRRWTVLASVAVFLGLGVLGLQLIAPRYSATARILIDPREQRVVQNELLPQGLGNDMALVESQIEVITSEAVLKRVVAANGLADDREFAPKTVPGQEPADAALAGLAKATAVTRPENTYVLQITVTAKEAAKAARLANAVAAAYLAYQADTTAGTARDVSSSIHDRLAQLASELHRSEEAVEAFKRENNVSESEGQLLGDRRLTDLSTRRSAALARVNESRTRFEVMRDALKSRGDVSAAVSSSDTAMNALRTQLAQAQRRLAEARQVLGPRHPRVVAAEGDVAQARETIRAESGRLVQAAEDDYRAAADTLSALDRDLGDAENASFDTNQDLIRLRELERKAQSDKVVYESFLVRAKETAQQESISARTARIIADAAIPAAPAYPPRALMLVAAGLMGLFVGVPLAVLQDLSAGLLAAGSKPMPAPADGRTELAGGLVRVVALRDPLLSRQAALGLAAAVPSERAAILVDFAADAPADVPGFADLALGGTPVAGAIRIDPATGIETLNAGRAKAVADLTSERAAAVLRAIMDEYDDVIVNAGTLEGGRTMLAETAGANARQTVLAVRDGALGRGERQAVKNLSAGGEAAVSVVATGPVGELARAA